MFLVQMDKMGIPRYGTGS